MLGSVGDISPHRPAADRVVRGQIQIRVDIDDAPGGGPAIAASSILQMPGTAELEVEYRPGLRVGAHRRFDRGSFKCDDEAVAVFADDPVFSPAFKGLCAGRIDLFHREAEHIAASGYSP